MNQAKDSVNLSENNKRSIEKLARTLRLTGGRRFELILARSNYAPLREQILQQLRQQSAVSIQTLQLPKTARQLYTRIQYNFQDQMPEALCILGLESIEKLEELLLSTNQVREEFRKNFGFPIVIWVTDEVLGEVIRLVPDFHNWTTPITFDYAPQELVELLEKRSDQLFHHILNTSTDYPAEENLLNSALNSQEIKENFKAKQELEALNHPLSDEIIATLKLGIGREHYRHNRFDKAERNYQYCLAHWQKLNATEKQGIVKFHLGLCHKRKSEMEPTNAQPNLQQAEVYFKQCLESFTSANRPDLVACFIGQLGETLLRLKRWNELDVLAHKSLNLHKPGQPNANNARLARDYGFLSQISLHNNDWETAQSYAEQALQAIQLAPISQRKHRALYQLALAKALQNQGQVPEAAACSEGARQTIRSLSDPILRISILKQLRELFIAQHNYLSAFEAKQEQRSIESQYGLRAFIGASRLQPSRQLGSTMILGESNSEKVAQEISVSDRQRDIDKLVNRIARDNFKLTIIHGQSGVGKSSTVRAGLIPTLRDRILKTRDVLTITLQYYSNWVDDLGYQLCDNLNRHEEEVTNPLNSGKSILEQLTQNQYRYISVLILDQFEEFFIGHSNQEERKNFLKFLSCCFKIPYTKVIIVMREDYLHYLLEFEHLATDDYYITNDILSAAHRYEIGNFSPEDAKAIIQSLTKRTQFNLEPALVDILVRDLAGSTQQVRPIELQIVGAQLQTESITTLDAYNKKGPKSALVQRYLEEVIKDCGPENQQAANLVLYLLTDENETRPPKTKDELESALKALAQNLATEATRLDLVLKIFVKSGLVFLLPSLPANRYQLVHDYLVSYIRRQQTPRISELTAELEEEREQRQEAEKQRDELKELNRKLEEEQAQRRKTESDLQRAQQRIRRGTILSALFISGAIIAISFIYAGWRDRTARIQAQLARIQLQGSELDRDSIITLQQFESEPLASLVNAMVSGQSLQDLMKQSPLNKNRNQNSLSTMPAYGPYNTLQYILDNIRSKNQIRGHQGDVYNVIFSPDGTQLLSSSADGSVRLWNMQGIELATIETSPERVPMLNANFSHDGQLIVTASENGDVKIWDTQSQIIQKSLTHKAAVNDVSFSPNNNRYIATASDDNTAQIWDLESNNSIVLNHSEPVKDISFSPDGKILVTASTDGKARLWDMDGKQLQMLVDPANSNSSSPLLGASFDPMGEFIATTAEDGEIKIWALEDGSIFQSFKAHSKSILGLNFSPDGTFLATTSTDRTTRVWNFKTGRLIDELKGHSQEVFSVNFNPRKSHILATASADGSIRTWNMSNKEIAVLQQEDNTSFRSIQFSNSGKYLAAGALDGSLYLWRFQDLNPISIEQSFTADAADRVKLRKQPIYSLRFSQDEQLIAASSVDGTIVIFDLKTKAIKEQISVNPELGDTRNSGDKIVWDVDFSPDSQYVATASNANGILKIWDLHGNLIQQEQMNDANTALLAIRYSHDGRYIATGGADGQITVLDIDNNRIIKSSNEQPSSILDLSFTPDDHSLVTASANNSVSVWNLSDSEQNLKLEKSFKAHINPVLGIDISIDNRKDDQKIVTSSEDGNIRLWSLQGKLLAEYSSYGDKPVRSVQFLPDGKHLIFTADSGQTSIWQMDSSLDDLLRRGCDWLEHFKHARKNVQAQLNMCE
ncbi:WD40 repeat-containing protein [Leptolyngbya sp. PCC 7375]|nr:WD40 repeat-containing protein [Leptolyngbya sp. PCC 7375]